MEILIRDIFWGNFFRGTQFPPTQKLGGVVVSKNENREPFRYLID